MLIEHPHDFARVHRRAAADGYDAVGFKIRHSLRALPCAGECRVGRNIEECGVGYTHLVKLVGYSLCIAVFIKELICYDKRFFLAHDVFKLVKRYGQAALLHIHLLGCSEPQHILSPLGNRFDIEQMLDTDILGDRVAAPRAAAQCERRRELEVIEVADTAL